MNRLLTHAQADIAFNMLNGAGQGRTPVSVAWITGGYGVSVSRQNGKVKVAKYQDYKQVEEETFSSLGAFFSYYLE